MVIIEIKGADDRFMQLLKGRGFRNLNMTIAAGSGRHANHITAHFAHLFLNLLCKQFVSLTNNFYHFC